MWPTIELRLKEVEGTAGGGRIQLWANGRMECEDACGTDQDLSQLMRAWQAYGNSSPPVTAANMQELGKQAFRFLFYIPTPPGREALSEVNAAGRWLLRERQRTDDGPMRLILDVDDAVHLGVSTLRRLPWELLYDETGQAFLLQPTAPGRGKTLIRRVRNIGTRPPLEGPDRAHVWVCLASPTTLNGFDTKWAADELEKDWRLVAPDTARLSVDAKPTFSAFKCAAGEFPILVLCGHVSRAGSEYGFHFLKENKELRVDRFVPASELGPVVANSGVRLVMINGCNSVELADGIIEGFHPLGQCELVHQLPIFVATNWEWPIVCAVLFQSAFLRFLFLQGNVSQAVMHAKGVVEDQIGGEIGPHLPYWSFPTIIMGKDENPVQSTDDLLQTGVRIDPQANATLGLGAADIACLLTHAGNLHKTKSLSKELLDKLQAAFRPNGPLVERQVCTSAFTIDRYPVTNRQFYEQYLKQTIPAGEGMPDEPAMVTYKEAKSYCLFVGKRLPTPQEWELAARGGTTTILPYGDINTGFLRNGSHRYNVQEARYKLNPKGDTSISSVYEFRDGASPTWGVKDMIGNAPEFAAEFNDAGAEHVFQMGMGHKERIVVNIPSFYMELRRDVLDAGICCGFRCVSK